MSSTRLAVLTPALSSMSSVAAPSHLPSVGPARLHASATDCHCSRMFSLNRTASTEFPSLGGAASGIFDGEGGALGFESLLLISPLLLSRCVGPLEPGRADGAGDGGAAIGLR